MSKDYRKVSELKLWEQNPRSIKEKDFDRLKKQIKDLGQYKPLLITKDNEVIGGNMRLRAYRDLGVDEVWVSVVNPKNEDEKLAYALSDNDRAGYYDDDLLANLSSNYPDFDWETYAVDLEPPQTLDKVLLDINEVQEDEVPEVSDEEPVSKLGEVYQLGRHRLMCGDSTKIEDVEKLMNGAKADMVFTDPPYGMKKEADGVLNDNLNYDKLLEFNKQWIPHTFDALKDNGSWYCWGIDEPLMDIYSNILKPMMRENKITFRNLLTWDKGHGQGQLSEDFRMYPIADEKCLFVMVGGDSVQGFCVNQEDYSENMDKVRVYLETEIKKLKQSDKVIANALGYKDGRTVNHWWSKSQFALPTRENYEALREYGKSVLKDYDFLKKDYDELKKDFYEGRSFFDNTHNNQNNVWHFDRTSNEERELTGGHATPKPIALCSRAIKSSSRENEIVLDMFGGSGSTLIACEQLNRTCYMMELDPKYCDVIRKRYAKFIGKEDEWEKNSLQAK